MSGGQQWVVQAGKSLFHAGEAAARLCVVSSCPCAHPSSVSPRFEVSEMLFILWRWREVVHGTWGAPLGLSKVVRSRAMNSSAAVSLQPLPLEGKEIFHCELTPSPSSHHPWRI